MTTLFLRLFVFRSKETVLKKEKSKNIRKYPITMKI